MVRRTRAGRSHPSSRFRSRPIACRTCGTVNAGVRFFPPPGFLGEEPRGHQGQGLVVVPPLPGADLVVGQPGLPLGPLQALLDPVLGLEHPGELRQRGVERGVRQQVVVLPGAVPCRSRNTTSSSATSDARLSARAWTSVRTACTTTGPFSPSRTSTACHPPAGTAAAHRSARPKGASGGRPQPAYGGSGAARSRTDVLDGTASR